MARRDIETQRRRRGEKAAEEEEEGEGEEDGIKMKRARGVIDPDMGWKMRRKESAARREFLDAEILLRRSLRSTSGGAGAERVQGVRSRSSESILSVRFADSRGRLDHLHRDGSSDR